MFRRAVVLLGVSLFVVGIGRDDVAREPCVTVAGEQIADGTRYELTNACASSVPCTVVGTLTCGSSDVPPKATRHAVSVPANDAAKITFVNTCAANEAWSVGVRWQCRE